MQMNDMILVSIDDHVIEPADAFVKHMSKKFKDRAPRVETHNGKDFWNIDGSLRPLSGLNAVVGRPLERIGSTNRHSRRILFAERALCRE
jgi:hypothetical protein